MKYKVFTAFSGYYSQCLALDRLHEQYPMKMKKKKKLVLPLKKRWYYMIRSGEKPEEYREMTPYWKARLEGKQFDEVEFTLGYPRRDDSSRRITFKNPKVRVGYGNPKWGAVEGRLYFVITWEL